MSFHSQWENKDKESMGRHFVQHSGDNCVRSAATAADDAESNGE
jgi:hypothetical protein